MADLDRARIESFLERFVDMAAGATTIGLLAVADRSGLSTHLAALGEGTVEEIASAGGLEPRYVEEILSGLAAAGVVEYEPERRRFRLPPEHALFLADESSPYFMGGFFDMIPALLTHLDEMVESTRQGGGVDFEHFGEVLVAALDRANSPSQRTFLVSRWLPAVLGLVDRLHSGLRVADVGCGSGTAACLIATAFPASRVFGYDTSPRSIATARDRAEGISNLAFEVLAIEDIPTDPGFGLITAFDVVHDLVDPLGSLRRIRAALGEEGVFLMMEPNLGSRLEANLHPIGALNYGISTLHCMTQSLARGGAGLGAAWGRERAEAMAAEAGFASFQPLDRISNRFSAFYLLRP